MGSQKRGEVGCLAENTGTSTLSWLGRIFKGSLWISNWTTLDPDHLSETAIAKILFGHQFAKDNPQWKFARMSSYWQFAELLTRTLTRPSILCVTQSRALMPVYIEKSGDLVGCYRCLTHRQTDNRIYCYSACLQYKVKAESRNKEDQRTPCYTKLWFC